jgi:hypothetical protein
MMVHHLNDLTNLLLKQRQSLAAVGLVSLKGCTIVSLVKLGRQPQLLTLDVSKTSLESLESLEPQESLIEVITDESALKDFQGLDRHPKLSKFSAISTLLAARPNFRIAALIIVGSMLSLLNGVSVTAAERDQTRIFPKIAKYQLQNEWSLELRDIPRTSTSSSHRTDASK